MTQFRPNPFLDDVYVRELCNPGVLEGTVGAIHDGALTALQAHVANLAGSDGAVVLLKSPVAGAGKSHLLARLASASQRDGFFVPLEVNHDARPSWTRLLRDVLAASANGDETFLDEMSRRLMGEATAELILRGDVPTADPAASIATLKRDYMRVFDMREGGSDISRWMMSNFSVLLPLMGEVLGCRAVIDTDEAIAWLRVLARFNAGNAADRKAALASVSVIGDDEAAMDGAKQRLRTFCRLAAVHRPLVMVFDHVDTMMHEHEDAAVLAAMIAELGRLRFGAGVIFSINGDVWAAAFDGQLPGALKDRLTGRRIQLHGMNLSDAEQLLRLRLRQAKIPNLEADDFFNELDLVAKIAAGSATPRQILRYAASVWERLHGELPETLGDSVKDYLPATSEMPAASSLAEPTTLRPLAEAVRKPGEALAEEATDLQAGVAKQIGNISSLLRDLKSRREQFVPGKTVSESPVMTPQFEEVDGADDASPLVRRFSEIRESILKKSGQRLDLGALRRMVSLAGERFPVVESSEFKMSPGEEPLVMKWVFPGSEILFGFEPEHQFRYWQSLIKLAARRVESGTAGRVKLVVFSDDECPFSGAACAEESELVAARQQFLDVIELDAGMAASVVAADRVVSEMTTGDEAVQPADAIRELAPQLDPLWRRITRPMTQASAEEV